MTILNIKESCLILTAGITIYTGSHYLYHYVKEQEKKLNIIHKYILKKIEEDEVEKIEIEKEEGYGFFN